MFGKEKKIKPKHLLKAAKKGDKLEDLLANVPENERQTLLNQALLDAVRTYRPAEDSIPALLNAGADASTQMPKGVILAQAIGYKQPATVIKELCDNGASFEDALSVMQSNNWDLKHKNQLKYYQTAFEGKPLAAEKKEAGSPVTEEAILKVLEIVQELREQVNDVTGQLGAVTKELEELKTAQPKTTPMETAQKKPVPAGLKFSKPTV